MNSPIHYTTHVVLYVILSELFLVQMYEQVLTMKNGFIRGNVYSPMLRYSQHKYSHMFFNRLRNHDFRLVKFIQTNVTYDSKMFAVGY